MKKCSTCKDIKDYSLFGKDKRQKDGLNKHCKKCFNEIAKEYYKKNKEKKKEYYKKNKDSILSKNNQTYNKEYHKEYNKKYHEKNKDKIKKRKNEYYENNKDLVLILNRAKVSRYRARAKSQEDKTVTSKIYKEIALELDNCPYCGVNLNTTKNHVDHIHPISKGGLHSIYNLIVSCSKCNSIKNAKSPVEWFKKIGQDKNKIVDDIIKKRVVNNMLEFLDNCVEKTS